MKGRVEMQEFRRKNICKIIVPASMSQAFPLSEVMGPKPPNRNATWKGKPERKIKLRYTVSVCSNNINGMAAFSHTDRITITKLAKKKQQKEPHTDEIQIYLIPDIYNIADCLHTLICGIYITLYLPELWCFPKLDVPFAYA